MFLGLIKFTVFFNIYNRPILILLLTIDLHFNGVILPQKGVYSKFCIFKPHQWSKKMILSITKIELNSYSKLFAFFKFNGQIIKELQQSPCKKYKITGEWKLDGTKKNEKKKK